MFPLFHLGPYIEVHTFWILLVVSWIVFFALLHKYAVEHALRENIFRDITLYTLSMFFWSRIFYIFTDWRNEKFLFINLVEWSGILDFLHGFFITENYNISLAGGIFWFLLVFIWKLYKTKISYTRSIDVLVRAFFWAAIIGFTGALLGGQIYGAPFDSFVSLLYTNKNSFVPVGSARFPLPIVYILVSLWWALLIEKIRKSYTLPDGFLWYIGFGFFGIMLFLWEFTSGIADMFESYPPYLWINQLVGLVFVAFSLVWIIRNTKI